MSESLPSKVRFRFIRTIGALMLREMSTTYGRSPGGYLWSFAEPIGGVALLTLVFSAITRTPPIGSNFPIFFATGFLPFALYGAVVGNVSASIRYSKPLLAYPGVTYVDAIIARLLLTVITQVLVTIIIFSMIMLIFDLQLYIDYLLVLRGLLMAAVFGLGVGLANCYPVSVYPIWQTIWAVLNRPLFIVSGIFFLIDPLPEKLRSALLLNPIAQAIMQTRNGMFDTYDALFVSEIYVYTVSLVLGALGMLALNRYYNEILEDGA
ncbi:ABC transporter permease [Jannaschia sp. M317]|uniref:ABC transporter permease n=1 Tax=Jannaschia sp. M317 TaxID=2867011 RepID=UPI0021A82FC2|nr:ABC transporter permease [Jannaschia sp. M317]UWQ19679.1 ABC transporter permease [Jannaschia sp. M317]